MLLTLLMTLLSIQSPVFATVLNPIVVLEEVRPISMEVAVGAGNILVTADVLQGHLIGAHTSVGRVLVGGGRPGVYLGHGTTFTHIRYVQTDEYRGAVAVDNTLGVYALQSFVRHDRTEFNLHRFGTLRDPVDFQNLADARVATATGATVPLFELLHGSRGCQHQLDDLDQSIFANFRNGSAGAAAGVH